MSVTQLTLRYRLVSYLLLLSLLAFGLYAMFALPRREDPRLNGRIGQIIAVYPGATALQVEQLVSEPLERALLDINDVKIVESTSRPGFAAVRVEALDRATDLNNLLDTVRKRVADAQADLPAGVAVQVNDHFTETAVMIVGVTWDGGTDRGREELAKKVRDRLRTLPDAAEVTLVGARQEQLSVFVSAQRMARFAVTPSQVAAAISRRNTLPLSGGSMALGDTRIPLSPTGQLSNTQEIADLVVAAPEGRPVSVRDVATIERGYADPPQRLVRVNGKPAVAVSLTMRTEGNITRLGDAVNAELAALRPTLPAGAAAITVNDLPKSVLARLGEFAENLITGVLLIFGVMILFMGLRSAAIVAAMLPITIIVSFGAMLVLGRDIQQISIACLIISLGICVDNSIVVIDNIERKLSEGMDRVRAVVEGTGQLAIPMLTSNLTTIASFLPFVLLSGPTGEFIRDLGIVTSLVTAVSLVLNYTALPLIALRYLRGGSEHREGWLRSLFTRGLDSVSAGIARMSSWGLRHAGLTVTVAVVALLVSLGMIPSLGIQFLPSAQRNQFTIDVWLPEGRDIAATERVTKRVEAILREQEGVRSFTSYVGQGGPRFYYNISPEVPAGNYAQLVVNTESIEATRRIKAGVQKSAEARITEARVTPRILEQGPDFPAPVVIRIAGDSVSELREVGARVKSLVRAIPGAASVHDDYGQPILSLKVNVDADRAALLGLSSADVAQATQMGFSGTPVSMLREGDKEIPIQMRLAAAERSDARSISDLYLPAAGGTVVPLRQVATVSMAPQESRIVRRNHVRTLSVRTFSDGSRLPSGILAEAQRKIQDVKLPPGYSVTYGGEHELVTQSFGEMTLIITLAIIMNLMIVAWEFNSWRVALTIMAAVPLSMTGAVLGLWITGQPFGLMAFLGITALAGVITNHEIVLFEYVQEEQKHTPSLDQALLDACRKRFRPILLTVLLAIGGLLPQAVNGGSLWPPMAWALIFGLLMSLFQTMVVMRAFYALLLGPGWRGDQEETPGAPTAPLVVPAGTSAAAPTSVE